MQKFTCLFIAIIAFSCPAAAVPLGFDDYIDSVLDESTGLIWLDVIATANRSFDDVSTELNSGIGLGAEGWRYASGGEFQQLVENWFGFSYAGGEQLFAAGAAASVEDFILTFGDTLQNHFTNVTPYHHVEGAGYAFGLLADGDANGHQAAIVYDGEYYNAFGGQHLDYADYVKDQHAILANDGHGHSWGSFLVRETAAVPESPSWAIMLIALVSIALRRGITAKRTP